MVPEEQSRAAKTDRVIGVLSLVGGGMQALFDSLNKHPTSSPVYILGGIGVTLLVLSLLIDRGVRAAAWLALVAVAAFAVLVNYWTVGGGISVPDSPARAIKGCMVVVFMEIVLVWAVVVQWGAQKAMGERAAADRRGSR